MNPKPRSEREVTADIVDYMQKMGYQANRTPAGPMFSRRGNQAIPQHTNPDGFPDWLFVHPDWYDDHTKGPVYIEVKAPGKEPTPLQRAWLKRLRRDGFEADWYDGFRAPEGRKPFLGDGK